jgi:hypothetical protein
MSTGDSSYDDAHTDAIAERCVAESKKDTGGPAFARPYSGTINYAQDGMSLRDYFAAKAMQGLIWNTDLDLDTKEDLDLDTKEDLDLDTREDLAEVAYAYADAMLKARKL